MPKRLKEHQLRWKRPQFYAPNQEMKGRAERTPLYRIVKDGNAVFFINDSAECLTRIISNSSGMINFDEGSAALDSAGFCAYEQVEVGEAVQIDEYDPYYDDEFIIQYKINVESPERRTRRFQCILPKGGKAEIVLMWDSGEEGRNVSLLVC
ncbi:MAG: hypothetical protein LAT68_06870 [Cyclobacteriaceae bacterium]|nr:hypothetical protein [Cyclobacteriaceae bacterium]MCH8516035.1 hypothetical protein [Cyclobacteriaceae bacterium]